MATFLTVLKIIGIVLLVILAVILILLLLILFVPILYKVDAAVPETELDNGFDKDKVSASAKFSWLLFVIRGGIEYPKNKTFTLKVFGIQILPKKEKPEKEKKSRKKKKGNEEETVTETEEKTEEKPEEKPEVKPEEASAPAEETTTATEEANDSATQEAETETDSSTSQDTSGKEDEDEPKSFLDVLWKIFDAIDNFLKTPLDVFEKIRCTISRVCDKIDLIKSTLENEIFKRAVALVKKMLIKVLKMSLPDKCDIKLLFGSGDPAVTAEIMGAYGALYPVLYKKVEFTPDFERKVVKADLHVKGHITVFTLVYCAAICFFNKDVKKSINRLKKIINS